MVLASRRTGSFVFVLICALAVSACGVRSPFRPLPEYEEEIYLGLDGTATVNVNVSIAATSAASSRVRASA